MTSTQNKRLVGPTVMSLQNKSQEQCGTLGLAKIYFIYDLKTQTTEGKLVQGDKSRPKLLLRFNSCQSEETACGTGGFFRLGRFGNEG